MIINFLETGEIQFNNEQPIQFTKVEHKIVSKLVAMPNTMVRREVLNDCLKPGATPKALDVHMFFIRKKIAHLPMKLETFRSRGYRLNLYSQVPQ